MREPYVTANNAVIADYGISAENCGSGIDYNIVSYIGMAFEIFDKRAVLCGGKVLCAECDVLIS